MKNVNYRCAFIVLYFGPLPDYFAFWARSCEHNDRNFHWFVYNDTYSEPIQYNTAVTIIPYDFRQLRQSMEAAYHLVVPETSQRLVCDYELLLPILRSNDEPFDGFEFVGFTDLDVIYGDIHPFLPNDASCYAMISANKNRPCGPFMLFNRLHLKAILNDNRIIAWLKAHLEKAVWRYGESAGTDDFAPMTGSRQKDALAKRIKFNHLDESQMLMRVAQQFAPVDCRADPLQPTMTRGFNFRKAFAVWENGTLTVYDNRGHARQGAFFHFSRFKKRKRFTIDTTISRLPKWGVYKYGFEAIPSRWTMMKMWLSLLY